MIGPPLPHVGQAEGWRLPRELHPDSILRQAPERAGAPTLSMLLQRPGMELRQSGGIYQGSQVQELRTRAVTFSPLESEDLVETRPIIRCDAIIGRSEQGHRVTRSR